MFTRRILILLPVLAAAFLFTCSRDDVVYNPSGHGDPVVCAAFVSSVPPAAPADTSLLFAADTVHTLDTLYLVGMVFPPGAEVEAFWDFGDNATASGLVCGHAYPAGGLYTAVFTIRDRAGISISDTVRMTVNTPPQVPILLLPDSGRGDVNPEVPLLFRWSARDADGEPLSYTIRVDTVNPPIASLAPVADTEYSLEANVLAELKYYYWSVKAADRFADSAVSAVSSFFTRDPNAAAQGALSGSVQRPGGAVSTGILITVLRNNTVAASARTDSAGAWLINDLPVGPVVIVFSDSLFFRPESLSDTVLGGETSETGARNLMDVFPPFITLSGDTIVKSGTPAALRIAARDTFYSVQSLESDLTGSFMTVTAPDTPVVFTEYGDHVVRVRATDIHGNASEDSIVVHVNFPPGAPALRSPLSGGQVQWNTSRTFSWDCSDADDPGNLRYDLFIGPARPLTPSNRVAQGISQPSAQWESGNISRPYYWKVTACDALDTVESATDSFTVGDFLIGRISGLARLQGVRRHNGIRLTFQGNQSYVSFTDDSGFCAVEVEPGTYNVTAEDTLRHAFETEVASGLVVQAGDSASFDTLVLPDVHAPRITCSFPAEGAVVGDLNPRTLTVTGAFTDTGSQVHVDSVHITINGAAASGVVKSSSAWRCAYSNIPDGRYTVRVHAADSAGNPAPDLVRTFTVNSKTIRAAVGFWHDTLSCSLSVANLLPKIRAFYFNYDKHATPAWNDSVKTTLTTFVRKWPLPDPFTPGRDTLVVMAVDDSGMAVYDTVPYMLVNDRPVVVPQGDTTVPMNSVFTLHGYYDQQFGKAVRYDWSINNGGAYFTRTSGPDTAITLYDRYEPAMTYIFKVTDDRGNEAFDTFTVAAGREWEPVGGAAFTQCKSDGAIALAAFSDNEIYLAFADPVTNYKIKVMKWNGSAWSVTGSGFSTSEPHYLQMGVGTGFGWGGATYSVPYLAYVDYTDDRPKVHRPAGDTVGTLSRLNGWTNPVAFFIPGNDGASVPYIAYSDHGSSPANKVRVKRYGVTSSDWDTVGAFASAGGLQVHGLTGDGANLYVLIAASMADTLKRLNGTAWQTLGTLSWPNNPAIALYNSSLYCADRDGGQSGKLTVRQWTGSAWTYAGGGPVSDYAVPYYFSGTTGMIGLERALNCLMAAYCEYNESGANPVLRIKSWDGSAWRTVGISGLPAAPVGLYRTSFSVRGSKPYVAYRDASNMITVLKLH